MQRKDSRVDKCVINFFVYNVNSESEEVLYNTRFYILLTLFLYMDFESGSGLALLNVKVNLHF